MIKQQSIIFGRHERKNSKVVQMDGRNTQTIASARKKNSCTYETSGKLGPSRKWTSANISKMTLLQRQDASTAWTWTRSPSSDKPQLEDPTRYQRVNNLNLGGFTALPLAKQELPPRSHRNRERSVFLVRTRSRILRSERV